MVYAVVSVKVNTTDCDSVNMGSIPIRLPKIYSIRLSVRTSGFQPDKSGSTPLSSTITAS